MTEYESTALGRCLLLLFFVMLVLVGWDDARVLVVVIVRFSLILIWNLNII